MHVTILRGNDDAVRVFHDHLAGIDRLALP
jgi:hypothetical protein